MSSSTPRKRRNNQHNSHQRTRSQHLAAQAAAAANQVTSDYESDTASYIAAHPPVPPAALAQRSNTELNLSVLRRYLLDIVDIQSIAANAVVYTLDATAGSWEKANVEGTLFVCRLRDPERACVFILNRKATDNLTLHLRDVKEIELKDPLLMIAMEDDSHVWGLFIHADVDSTRVGNAELIQSLWRKDRESMSAPATDHVGQPQLQGGSSGAGVMVQGLGGRQVSLNELFGR
jgi:hypothetical protein